MAISSGGLTASDNSSETPIGIATRRKLIDRAFWVLCTIALLFVVAPVVWILAGVVSKAISVWHWTVLTQYTNGVGGGLLQDIQGTFLIMVCVGFVAGLVGVGGGIYLAEMQSAGRVATMLRSASEVLAGIPSIVFGYCGYLTLVVGLHWGFSLLPAVLVLSMLVVPYIVKATELSLGQVPTTYREGAEALGMSKVYLLRKIVIRAGLPGILTGLIVALAISVGETAPLLYTAGDTTAAPSLAVIGNHPVGYLTYAVYSYLDEPIQSLKVLSYDAAFLLVIIVLALILCSRLLVRIADRYSPQRALSGGGRAERRAVRANSRSEVR